MAEHTHSKKYQQLVDTARDLFFKHGIRRITVEEICRESQVSKVTFYKYFANKHTLVHKILVDMVREGEEKYNAIMNQDIPFEQKIDQFIKLKLDYQKQMGKEFFIDWNSLPPESRDSLLKWQQEVQGQFFQMLEDARKAGDIRKTISIRFITYFLNKVNELYFDPELFSQYADPAELTEEFLQFFFYGIMERK